MGGSIGGPIAAWFADLRGSYGRRFFRNDFGKSMAIGDA